MGKKNSSLQAVLLHTFTLLLTEHVHDTLLGQVARKFWVRRFTFFNRWKLPLTIQVEEKPLSLNQFNESSWKRRPGTLTSSGGCMSSQASTWHCIIFKTKHKRKKRTGISPCLRDLKVSCKQTQYTLFRTTCSITEMKKYKA